jgi:hypothetical protein
MMNEFEMWLVGTAVVVLGILLTWISPWSQAKRAAAASQRDEAQRVDADIAAGLVTLEAEVAAAKLARSAHAVANNTLGGSRQKVFNAELDALLAEARALVRGGRPAVVRRAEFESVQDRVRAIASTLKRPE